MEMYSSTASPGHRWTPFPASPLRGSPISISSGPIRETPGVAVIANSQPLPGSATYLLLGSATYLLFESFRKASATIRAIGTRLERGFADFADIPYQDARTRQELSRLLDEC